MGKAKDCLLALVYQHLLKNGYSKTARELQIESGELFASPKVTLKRVYKLWSKKSKKKKKTKKKQDGTKSKKPHESSNKDHADLEPETKKSSDIKAKKSKPVKKKMKVATEAAADVKVTPKKARPSLNNEETVLANAVHPAKAKPGAEKSDESSSSSESEEETTNQVVRNKTMPTSTAKLKSLSKTSNGKTEVRESSESSDETDIDKPNKTSKATAPSSVQTAKGKRKATPPAPQVQADDSTESSETEEEEEQVKQVVTQTPKLTSKAPSSLSAPQSKVESSSESSESDSDEEPVKKDKPSTKTASTVKASLTKPTKGQSKKTIAAKAAAEKAQLKSQKPVSDSESNTSDSEDEKQKPSAVISTGALASPLTPVVTKAVTPAEETSEEESSDSDEEPATKTPATVVQPKTLSTNVKQTPVVAAKSPLKSAQAADDSSEESSDSDEEPPAKASSASAGTKQTKVVETPLKTQQPADDSSEESDSDEEPTSKKPATVPSLSQQKTPEVSKPAPALAKSKNPVKTTQPADESSEESSDSDEEHPATKPATVVQSSQPKTPPGGAKKTPLSANMKTPLKTAQADSESSEEKSDSDEETALKKPAKPLQSAQPKTPGGGAQHTAIAEKSKTPLKSAQPTSESSEESDSDDEPTTKTTPATPVKISASASSIPTVKPSAANRAPDSDADSESSDSSDTENKQVSKSNTQTRAAPEALVVPVKAQEGKPATPGKLATVPKPAAADTSDSSDSDEEEAQATPAAVLSRAKGKRTVSTALKPDKSSEESESESDIKPVKLTEVKTVEIQKAKQSASVPNGTAQPATPEVRISKGKRPLASKTPVLFQTPARSSESSKSSDEDLPPAQVTSTSLKGAPPSVKSTVQPVVVDKHKAGGPVKPVPATKSAAGQETSDSSESSDSEKEQTGAQKHELPVDAKKKKTPMPAPLFTSTPCGSTGFKEVNAPVEATVQDLTPSFVKSKSGRETGKLAKTSTPLTAVATKSTNQVKARSTLKKVPMESLSESSDSESSEEAAVKVTTSSIPTVVKEAQAKVSGKLKTPSVTSPVPGKTTASSPQKLKQADPESSSESSDSETEPSVKVSGKLKTASVTSPLPGKTRASNQQKPKQADPESSSESSDSEEEPSVKVNTTVPTAVKAAQTKVSGKLKTASVTSPVPGKTRVSSQQKLKQADPESSSESSDSEEEPSVKRLATPDLTTGNQVNKVVNTPLAPNPVPNKPKGTSVAKTPLQAGDDSSTEASDSEEDTAKKVASKGLPKPAELSVKTPQISTEVKGKVTSLTRSPMVRKPSTAETSSSSSESDEEPTKKPIAATPKPAPQHKAAKTTKQNTAVLQKKQENSSEESGSDDEEPGKQLASTVGKTQKKTESASKLIKLKSPSPVKSSVVTKPKDSSDSTSSDSEDDVHSQNKGAATGNLASSQEPVDGSVSKMSSTDVKKRKTAVLRTQSGASKSEDSQPVHAPPTTETPKKRKKDPKTESVLVSVVEKKRKKKEAKNKVQPDTIPVPPTVTTPEPPSASAGALLESEEETVLALLEGRSPKKAKKSKGSKRASETAIHIAEPTVQNNNVSERSPLPPSIPSSAWVPESPTSADDKSALPTTEVPSLSDKKAKSIKKRKISQDDVEKTKKTAKKAKIGKKDKKIEKSVVGGANVTPKPKSDKKKPEKDMSKKKTKAKEGKKKKEEKKKADSNAAAVVESTDSGISLSKPKKKKKL